MALAGLERRDDANRQLAADPEAGARRRTPRSPGQPVGRLHGAVDDANALGAHARCEHAPAHLLGDGDGGGDRAVVEQIGPPCRAQRCGSTLPVISLPPVHAFS